MNHIGGITTRQRVESTPTTETAPAVAGNDCDRGPRHDANFEGVIVTEVQSTHPNRSPHALYRFYDAGGTLLYVGVTLNPVSRWKQHSKDKPWWADVADIKVERHDDRRAVLAAERDAIIRERPRYNVVHNGTRAGSAALKRAAAAMPDDCHGYCAKIGIYSIYHPHTWGDGVAHYTCHAGHSWSRGWNGAKKPGSIEANRCVPVDQRYDIPALTAARNDAQSRIDAYLGTACSADLLTATLRLRAVADEAIGYARSGAYL